MPIWDFRCANEECEHTVLDRFQTPGRELPRHCGKPMVKMPASGSFVVKGHNAANGYNGGQIKEVKVAGHKDMRVVVKS